MTMTTPTSDVRQTLLAHWHTYGFERAVLHTDRFCALARSLRPDQLALPVDGLDWRVIDVVAHVTAVYRRYTVNPRRATDRFDVARHNAEDLADLDLDVDALTDDMVSQLETLGGFIEHVDPTREFPFHAEQPITMAGGWGNMLGELLAHGDDIARTVGLEWTMDGADLEPLWRYSTKVLGGWLNDAGRREHSVWELDLGFASGPVRIRFTGGGVAVDEDDDAPVDHHITGDAFETALVVPYRRRASDDAELLAFGALIEAL